MKRERRHRIEAGAAALIAAAVSLLPRRAMLAVGRGLGRLWGALDRRHVEIGRQNLRQAFPDWPEPRIDATARAVYRHFGMVMLDILWLSTRSAEAMLRVVEWDGREHSREAVAAGRGVLYVTAHFGNWEVFGVAHGYHMTPIGVVARPLDNPHLDERLCAFRRASGNTVISKWQALQEVLRLIRSGGGLAVLIDQNVQEKDGIFVDFFGRPAATTTVAAAVALKTGCAVVPVWAELLPSGRYRLHYDAPLRWESHGDRRADIAGLTQALTSRIEQWVRERPEQWLWIHRRWKTRPASSAEKVGPPEGAPADAS